MKEIRSHPLEGTMRLNELSTQTAPDGTRYKVKTVGINRRLVPVPGHGPDMLVDIRTRCMCCGKVSKDTYKERVSE